MLDRVAVSGAHPSITMSGDDRELLRAQRLQRLLADWADTRIWFNGTDGVQRDQVLDPVVDK
jgi:hypothetical protein